MQSSRTYPEEHPVAAMMAMTALVGASTLKERLGDPLLPCRLSLRQAATKAAGPWLVTFMRDSEREEEGDA